MLPARYKFTHSVGDAPLLRGKTSPVWRSCERRPMRLAGRNRASPTPGKEQTRPHVAYETTRDPADREARVGHQNIIGVRPALKLPHKVLW